MTINGYTLPNKGNYGQLRAHMAKKKILADTFVHRDMHLDIHVVTLV